MTEAELGAAMLALARKEGHQPQAFGRMGGPEREQQARAMKGKVSPETKAIMAHLATKTASTRELARVAGLAVDPTAWRLKSLERGGFVKVVGRIPAVTSQMCVWALGENGPHWLEQRGMAATRGETA